jgi:hypothetical protein
VNRLILGLLTVSAALAGCSSPSGACDGGACPDAGPVSRCLTAVLPACDRGADPYSDEACSALDDAEGRAPATVDGARAPTITAPANQEALPSTTRYTFRWSAPMAFRISRTPARWLARADARPEHAPLPAQSPSFAQEISRWTALVPEAHAHCAPFSGVGYGLDFRANGRVILRVEQSLTEYTPTPAAWDILRGATGPIEIRITAARFRNSAVSEGPFESPARRTFTITP